MMKKLSKYLFTFLSSFIISSFILAPVPQIQVSLGVAWADDCEDTENPDGSEGVYRPGCEFKKDLTTTDINSTSGTQEGLKKALDQYVGVMFGVVMMSAMGYKYTERSQTDCPMNRTADITMKMTQAGSMVYLLGEVRANMIFRKAAKIAVDKNFQARQNENTGNKETDQKNIEANDKQMAAFEALIKIYEEQIRGLEAKKASSILAEIAYAGALGVEIAGAQTMKAMCDQSYNTSWTSFRTTLNTNLTTARTSSAASQATCSTCPGPTCNPGCAASCGAEQAALGAYQGVEQGIEQSINAQSKAMAAQEEGFFAAFFAKISSLFASMKTAVLGEDADKIDKLSGEVGDVAATAQEQTKAQQASTARDTNQQTAQTSSDAAVQAGNQCLTNAVTQASMRGIEIASRNLIYCCGSEHTDSTPTVRSVVPYPSIMDKKTDIYWEDKKTAYDLNVIKELNYGLMQKIARETIYKNLDATNPEKAMAVIAKTSRSIDFLVNEQIEILKKSKEVKNFDYENATLDGVLEDFQKQLSSIRTLVIKDVHADSGTWKELLNLGVKMLILQKFLGNFIRKALVKPKSRMWVWGIMGAINAAMIKFHSDSLDDAEKRLMLVYAEAERFASSRVKKTVLDEDEKDKKDGKTSLDRYNPIPPETVAGEDSICAVPSSGGGFAPATCSKPAPSESTEIVGELSPEVRTNLGGQFTNTLGQFSRAARAVADGGRSTDASIVAGNLQRIDGERKAFKQQVEKLAKDFDDKDKSLRSSDGKLKSGGLKVLDNLRRAYKDYGPGTISGSPLIASRSFRGGNLSDSKKEEPIKKKVANSAASFKGISIPKRKGLNLSFDDEDEDSEGLDLEYGEDDELNGFVVSNEDITQDKNKNIFKLISHRYLMAYPSLLNEKK